MHLDHTPPLPSSPPVTRAPVRSREHRPDLPEAPPAVRDVLRRGVVERRFLFPENGPARQLVRWEPPLVDPQVLVEVEVHLRALEATLTPAGRGGLLARVLALLSHYRLEPNPPQVEMCIADDWAEDLGGFPIWAVDEAARRWRRTHKFRPRICEMIALCEEAVGDCMLQRDRLCSVVARAQAHANPLARHVARLTVGLVQRMAKDAAD